MLYQIIVMTLKDEREESGQRSNEVYFLKSDAVNIWLSFMYTLSERDGQFILGLVNTQNYCFANSVLQVKRKCLITKTIMLILLYSFL